MRIEILAFGKLKEQYWREACGEYIKRLSVFCDIKISELPEARLGKKPSPKEIGNCLEREGEALSARLAPRTKLVALCIEGRRINSESFAEFLDECAKSGFGAQFAVGSSYGLAEAVKQKADLELSFSAMTFPHQLARIMLLEQIYRAFGILKNSKYHKQASIRAAKISQK
ncbi:MAG: 23S rRNA (pseudouridine(1915)-N(3))-methyltransferase RlmH [Oscillospiraceae bacterium]|jgi:23S rRNA (pseudouridine1915-N3)-methyltransferase|nr:23S rRNA (pseudouridine(1915)-N(3))-methyltransferase RlmH [Oscillospiraceae bacterium]